MIYDSLFIHTPVDSCVLLLPIVPSGVDPLQKAIHGTRLQL